VSDTVVIVQESPTRVRVTPPSVVVTNQSLLPSQVGRAGYYLKSDGSVASWQPVVISSVPVTSVFGRAGAVVAALGDYTVDQVTNALSSLDSYADPSWITSLAGSKVVGDIAGNAGGITGPVSELSQRA